MFKTAIIHIYKHPVTYGISAKVPNVLDKLL